MIVDLTTLKERQTKFDFSVSSAEIDLEDETAKLIGDIKVEGKLTKGIVETEIEGTISGKIKVECTRCLQPVETSLGFPFEASFVAPENYTQEKEAELKSADLEIALFEGDKIDLTGLAREQILLNLPTQIFCREDCKGLCAKCGANRNLIDCKCEKHEVDPRWSTLKNLKL